MTESLLSHVDALLHLHVLHVLLVYKFDLGHVLVDKTINLLDERVVALLGVVETLVGNGLVECLGEALVVEL